MATSKVKELEKQLEEAENEAAFFRLFYRERLAGLAQLLDGHAYYNRDPRIRQYALKVPEVIERLKRFMKDAENPDLCHDICKSMYFCDRPKGHEGSHAEGELVWP
jgi:hypothetical protein